MASIDQAVTRQAARQAFDQKPGASPPVGTSPEVAGEPVRARLAEALERGALLDRATAERIAQDPDLERAFLLGLQCGRVAPPQAGPARGPAPEIRERPATLGGVTYEMLTGCGPLYVTINESDGRPFELFTTMGKAGGCAASQCEAIGRMVSLAWRGGVDPRPVVRQLVGISCHQPSGFGDDKVLSCADAVARAVERHLGG